MKYNSYKLSQNFVNVCQLLELRTQEFSQKTVFTFSDKDESKPVSLTYGELARKAQTIAAALQERRAFKERVLLIYAPGLEFIAAFLGCLYAGAIAVPAYPPRKNHHFERLQAILHSADARFVLTTQSFLETFQTQTERWTGLETADWMATDRLAVEQAASWQMPAIAPDHLAMVQYTSGSTGQPKGVMLQHQHLLHNLHLIHQCFQDTPDSLGVCWLPPYHDMGLIGGILQPLFVGGSSLLMSPVSFLQRPLRWLELISRDRATTAGAPNFAYDLCVNAMQAKPCEALDLSGWTVAFVGAEPIQAQTLRRFAEVFAPFGFAPSAFLPCYGMAETTLIVTGASRSALSSRSLPKIKRVDAVALRQHQLLAASDASPHAVELVSCGQPLGETRVAIVHPDTGLPCAAGAIGEIWVAGQSVAAGYWQQPELTQATFQAHLHQADAGTFLRTGDLGFLEDGELFVTGRLKELVIIRGRNYYPQDIEQAVQSAHAALRSHHGAVFAVERQGGEALVVVQEVERSHLRQLDAADVVKAIRRTIAEQFELQVADIVLLKPSHLPKTTSGKIQRFSCRQLFLQQGFEAVYTWSMATLPMSPPTQTVPHEALNGHCPALPPSVPAAPWQARIQQWLVAHVSTRLGLAPSDLAIDEPLATYGLSSLVAVQLAGELEAWLGVSLEPTLLYDHPSIAQLSAFLAPQKDPEAVCSKRFSDATTAIVTPRRRRSDSDIAVIGLGCRFPGAPHPEAFWQLLVNGSAAIQEVPSDRWNVAAYYDSAPGTPGKMNTRWGGFLAQVDEFDAPFFRISGREAANMDPQQRLLLEVTWEALEYAGIAPQSLAGSQTGVFIGISSNDYARLIQAENPLPDPYSGTSHAFSIAANRLSYTMDWRGPSIAVDTACSSSLVAIHQACHSLRHQDCQLAVAGGVNLILHPDLTVAFSQAQMLAADGRCKTFDAQADGYVRGEGCGIVVLKCLEDARRDGDVIYGVIKGSAVNQDGRSNGLTAPNYQAQSAVIAKALQQANVLPSQVSYVEAHGTGTVLGDPIEVKALKAVYGNDRTSAAPLWLGSVKTNVGHLEAAAGIASLIKVVLALHHQQLPATLNFTTLNPLIDLSDRSLQIAQDHQAWKRDAQPRLAGVSAFGFGGTNVHLIVAEAPALLPLPTCVERPYHLFTVSATTPAALTAQFQQYQTFLSRQPEQPLADLCFTANSGRSRFRWRQAFVVQSVPDLQAQLAAAARAPVSPKANETAPKIAFLFTGQGSQFWRMGQQLYETQPRFRACLERCEALLQPLWQRSLIEFLYQDAAAEALIHETQFAQPALFALEYALADLWMSWGIQPDVLLGHSLGEYVAACIAGVFSLEDGLRLVVQRGQRLQTLSTAGKMAAVFAAPEQITPFLSRYEGLVAIAAHNAPQSLVLSGHAAAMEALLLELAQAGLDTRSLQTSQGFHSDCVEPALSEIAQLFSGLTLQPPQIPLVSNLTGQLCEPTQLSDPEYWRSHTRQTVQFQAGMNTLQALGCTTFLEIGPQPTLIKLGRRCFPHQDADADLTWLASLDPRCDDWTVMLRSLVTLYQQGAAIDWQGFEQGYSRRKVSLPTYPFQRQRHWFTALATPLAESDQPLSLPSTQALSQTAMTHSTSVAIAQSTSSQSTVDRQTHILTLLQEKARQLFLGGQGEVNAQIPLLELGADSINLLEISHWLAQTFDVQVSVRQLFETVSTLDDLARYLHEQLPPQSLLQTHSITTLDSAAITPLAQPQALSTPPIAPMTATHQMAALSEHLAGQAAAQQVSQASTRMPEPASENVVGQIIQSQIDLLAQLLNRQLDLLAIQSAGGSPANQVVPLHQTQATQPPLTPSAIDLTAAAVVTESVVTKAVVTEAVNGSKSVVKESVVKESVVKESIAHSVQSSRTIPATDRTQPLPLALPQQRLWWLEQLAGAQNVYLIPVAVQLDGVLNATALEDSLNAVIARHESLRTAFYTIEGQPVQQVRSARSLHLLITDTTGVAPETTSYIDAAIQQLSHGPFDLENDLLLRAQLLRLSDRQSVLLLVFHHLIADAWSVGVLVRELLTLYPAHCAGQTAVLPPLPIQYGDFAVWQRQVSDTQQRHLDYWQRQLTDAPSLLSLPTDYPRPIHQTFQGKTYHQPIGTHLTQSLKAFSQRSGVTLFMTLLSVYGILLSRYSGQTDLVVGSPIAARQLPETQPLIGLFLNTLILRLDLSGNPTVPELLARVKQMSLDAYAHPDLPVEQLVEALKPDYHTSHSLWFQVMFILQSTPRPQLALPELNLSVLPVATTSAKYDLTLWMEESASGLRAEWEYNTDLFSEATIARMAEQFQTLLEAIVENSQQPVAQLRLLSPHQQQILDRFTQTDAITLPLRPVHQWFEAQAQQTPNAIALEHQDTSWSYQTLNQQANQMAHALRSQGQLSPGDLVAVCLDRSPHLIATLLGVLKAGAAYLPLDPTYPPDRLHQMMTDAQPKVLVISPVHQATLHLEAPFILDVEATSLSVQPQTNPLVTVDLTQTAYVIYTSGSTGKPKGTLLTHRGLANFTQQAIARYGFCAGDRVLQFASISFDAAVEEIYGTLCSGGTLVLRTDAMLNSSAAFCDACAAQQLSVLDLPTAFWHRLTQDIAQGIAPLPPSLRLVIIGGERVLPALVSLWQTVTQHHAIRLLNTYGPTEATVVATTYEITPQTEILEGFDIPIGRPLGNVQVYVLDEHLNQMPLGVPGELYLGGDGLAAGYLNRPELTAERFIAHPFQPEGRLYKTGDRVRFLPSGDLVYLGRTDDQVKVRGFRIELGEVENVLQRHSAVQECAVMAQTDEQGMKQLIAYVVADGSLPPDLRQFMQAQVPDYMVPALFIPLANIPLTPAGKLDRRSLPAPQASDWTSALEYIAPRTPTEAALSFIVAEVLNVKQVGIQDNFFSLGGHSLAAMQVLTRIRTMFGKEVSLRSLFESPTVAALAAQLEGGSEPETTQVSQSIPTVDRSQPLQLSAAQQQLWFLSQFEGDSATYNVPFALQLKGEIDVAALEHCLNAIVRRHESLRTVFEDVDGQGIQVIQPQMPLTILVEALTAASPLDPTLQARMQREAQIPFNLQTGPLLRVVLLRSHPAEHFLLVTMHHIIADAWSIGVFVQEVMTLYPAFCEGRSFALNPLPVQYADYAAWQRQQQQTAIFQQRLQQWVEQLSDAPPLLALPTDYPRPAIQTFQGRLLRVEIPPILTEQIQALSQQHRTTLFSTLLTAFVTLMHRYSRQTDLVIGTPIAGRDHPDLEALIGFFINTLPLRFQLDGSQSFLALLEQVQSTALDAFANQDIPFAKLVEALPLSRDLSYLPLCQVMFILQNAPETALEISGLTLEAVPTHSGVSRFDLTLSLFLKGDRLLGEWEYNSDLFAAATIERMSAQFQVLLESIVANPQQAIATLPLFTAAERQTLLIDWNQTERDYPHDRCIHELVEAQAQRTPEAIAVRCADRTLTYRELDEQANQLAHYLQTQGVEPNTLIGLSVDRNAGMLIGLLGILKAGAAYVPLDPAFPADRLTLMVNDAQLALVITQAHLTAQIPTNQAPVLCLDADWEAIVQQPKNPVARTVPATAMAYVIYTSGSTGRPKGVQVTHRNVANFLSAMQERPGIRSTDTLLAVTTLSFDIAVLELFLPLSVGATVLVAAQDVTRDGDRLCQLLVESEATVMQATPSTWRMLVDTGWTGNPKLKLLCGGEALSPSLAQALSDRCASLWNLYGPTETTVWSLCDRVDVTRDNSTISIGTPIANTQVYVLGEDRQPVPIGVPGELWLGGDGVTPGYLKQPELTAERFIPHPFSADPTQTLYRTGDLVKYRPDGRLVYLGRLDHQVKLRGFRIELGEIEAVLVQHPQVKAAVAIVCQSSTDAQLLVAYVVTHGQPLLTAELQAHAQASLPHYMVPAAFVVLESLPLTPNGKVDRKALPAPQGDDFQAQSAYVAPRTELEVRLVELWSDLLGIDSIGINANFFELGGHSLSAMQLVARIRTQFQIDLPLRSLFETPTIAHLAALILSEQLQQTDDALLEQLFAEVEHLSDDAVQQLLHAPE